MKKKQGMGTIILAILIGGCAGQTGFYNYEYTEPSLKKIENEIIVASDYDETWSKMVGEMSKSFYVINNIDKESRLINLSFSISSNISDYVDCGVSNKSFTLEDLNESISYQTADKSENYVTSTANLAPPNTTYYKIFRAPSLEGRANVYVAPQADKTVVSVNTRYVWNVKIYYETYEYMPLYDSHYKRTNKKLDTSNPVEPVSFNTNTVGGNDGDVTCVATGKFEREILDIL